MSVEDLIEEVEIEFEYIETVLDELTALDQKPADMALTLVEITAAAGFLHNFYNGVENIFKRILKFSQNTQGGHQNWHKELLKKFYDEENDFAFLDQSLYENLLEILKFRHVFIHGYGFLLKWELLKPLIKKTLESYPRFKSLCIESINRLNSK